MKIYNTFTKTKEEFVPIEPGKVKIYVCGPTVYSFIHIGNARPIVVFDVLHRYLEYKGYEVTYATNFTDVDDKIIKRANEEGVEASVISERYIGEYLKDVEGLKTAKADCRPKVTEEIGGIIEMIKTLIEKGYAYEKNGSVYFSTTDFKPYGLLSGKKLKELEAGARVEIDEEKRNPSDFVLWKPAKPGEPKWASPWSEGRPGWHIECSVMSKKYLGDTIDIHAGGDDLIFPHHENEIAQSEAANGKKFVNYWMHNAMLTISGKKMGKSEGNFLILRDIIKDFSYDVIRFLILTVHYRSPMNFSRDLMEAAETSLTRIRTAYSNLKFRRDNAKTEELKEEEQNSLNELQKYITMFEESLDDDLNTANAVTAVFELVKFSNVSVLENSSKAQAQAFIDVFDKLADVLGIKLEETVEIGSEKIEALIAERQLARKNKDFAAADRIRNELSDMGITLNDTPEGVKWTYKEKK